MTERPHSLQALFAAAKVQKKALESSLEPNSESYRDRVSATIANLEECQKLVSQVSLFSSNESLEDVSTSDLQYGPFIGGFILGTDSLQRFLTVEYLLAEVLQRSSTPDRENILRQALIEYEKYLTRLDEYELLSTSDKKLFERYLENPSVFALASMNDAANRREVKVARFRQEKELKQKLEVS
jgi:hypothetical protein